MIYNRIVGIVTVLVLINGCSTSVPVKRNFPDVPAELMQVCPDLDKVKSDETKLSQVLITVTGNYSKYHECKVKSDAWIEWYKQQKEVFDSVK
jgi:hypothetical protein